MRRMDWIAEAQNYRQVAGTCEYGNQTSDFTNCGEFLD